MMLVYDMDDLWGFVSFYGPSQTDTYECGEYWILHGMVHLLDCEIHSQERWVYSILAGMKKTIWGNREGTEISLVRVRLLPPLPMNEGGYRRPAVRDKVEEGLYGKEDEGL